MLNWFEWFVIGVDAVILAYISCIYILLLSQKKIELPLFHRPYTVIIPCYNEAPRFLERCVKSVVEANGEKQVILVDNNSNKRTTIKMITKLTKKYPDILVLQEKRQGKRFAHSRGLHQAEYELIVFVDSD